MIDTVCNTYPVTEPNLWFNALRTEETNLLSSLRVSNTCKSVFGCQLLGHGFTSSLWLCHWSIFLDTFRDYRHESDGKLFHLSVDALIILRWMLLTGTKNLSNSM